MSEEKSVLKETEEFMDSIISQSFFLMQVDFSRKVLKKTNAYKIKKTIEDDLKRMSNEIARKNLNNNYHGKNK